MLLPLGPERTHMEPSRVPERRHEHECLDFRPSDLDQALPEVDLQLPTRGVSNRVVASASAFSAWQ
ncbi:hypothetical protein ACVWWO_003715 [Bradyrhizobium sp. F1.13.1]